MKKNGRRIFTYKADKGEVGNGMACFNNLLDSFKEISYQEPRDCVIPKDVNEGDNEQDWATDSKQPQQQEVWNSCMLKIGQSAILVAVVGTNNNVLIRLNFHSSLLTGSS